MKNNKIYDMIIVGGGPGGYTAALYAARAGLSTLVVEKLSAGGQMALTHQIDNYPGFPGGVDGFTLGQDMKAGAERFGAETVSAQVTALQLDTPIKEVTTQTQTLLARTVVIATGANPRPLGIPQEAQLVGKGVSYCGHCDGMFFRGRTVAVVGGGNSAVAEVLFLSRIAKKVYLIHRRDTLRATQVYRRQLERLENVEILWERAVTRLHSNERLTGVTLKYLPTGQEEELSLDGLFVSIGRDPANALVQGALTLDNAGYILADETTKTNLPGVYAVGDIRSKELRQIVTAVADGAVAAYQAEHYLP
ncbi:MAG: thioredoxin-disulfide reductase [Oscillospiraceae bacterium]|nr:thioredoxin-disulfide reductase [Oscillospiraceae bacterium]